MRQQPAQSGRRLVCLRIDKAQPESRLSFGRGLQRDNHPVDARQQLDADAALVGEGSQGARAFFVCDFAPIHKNAQATSKTYPKMKIGEPGYRKIAKKEGKATALVVGGEATPTWCQDQAAARASGLKARWRLRKEWTGILKQFVCTGCLKGTQCIPRVEPALRGEPVTAQSAQGTPALFVAQWQAGPFKAKVAAVTLARDCFGTENKFCWARTIGLKGSRGA